MKQAGRKGVVQTSRSTHDEHQSRTMIVQFMNDWRWYTALLLFTAVTFGGYGAIIWHMLR